MKPFGPREYPRREGLGDGPSKQIERKTFKAAPCSGAALDLLAELPEW